VKVLHVVGAPSGQTGSFERHLLEVVRQGRLRGMETQLCYPSALPETSYRAELEAAGVRVWHLSARGRLDLRFLRAVTRLVRRERIDVVHGHFEPGSHLGAAAGRLARRPVVLTRHYLAPNARRSAHGVSTWAAGRLAKRFIAVSEPVRDSLLRFAVPEAVTVTLPLGVDLDVFHPRPELRAAERARLGLDDATTCVVATSHHRPGKGVEVLIEAVAGVPGLVLLLAGEGELTPRLRLLAATSGADVRFLGRVDDVAALLSAADVFCLPTVDYPEGLPMAVVEAMAMGVPVVATPVPALLPLLTGTTEAGLVVPAGDPSSLAGALRRLGSDPSLRDRLGRGGLERSLDLDVRLMAEAVLDVYASVAEPSR